MSGNHVSHAHNLNKRRFLPNLHKKRFWVPEENRWITLTVSAKGMKTISKNGIYKVLPQMRARGQKI